VQAVGWYREEAAEGGPAGEVARWSSNGAAAAPGTSRATTLLIAARAWDDVDEVAALALRPRGAAGPLHAQSRSTAGPRTDAWSAGPSARRKCTPGCGS
jgi:hypothetical protein